MNKHHWTGLFAISNASIHLFSKRYLCFMAVFFFSLLAHADNVSSFVYPTIDDTTDSAAVVAHVKQGEYLVKAGDCIACHTTANGQVFAGGLPIKTPFGTLYSPNITPDKATGIASWSDNDFDKAMREGISPHGTYFYPVFPFVYYNKLTHQDILDIKEYLDRIPAIHQENRPLEMKFPFNIRLLQSFWRFMFFDFNKGQFSPDMRQSDEWNRGAYLVQGLGHCAMCHTPINPLGAAQHKYELTGGFVDGYHAPNISASRLKDIPTQTILKVFLEDRTLQGGHVQGPMLEVNHNSLRYLNVDDLTAIVTYLKTVQSETPPVANQGTGEEAGKAIYEKYCAGCHTMGGGGAPAFGNASQWSPRIKAGMTSLYQNAISGINGMPAKGNCDSCTNDQVKLAVDYIIKNSQGAGGKSTSVISPAQSYTSLIKGHAVYEQVCSVCHAQGQLHSPRLGDDVAWKPLLKQNLDILIQHALTGYKGHPSMGACYQCSDADVIAAVKYMAQQSSGSSDYRLW